MKINTEIIRNLNPCRNRFNNYLKYYSYFNGTIEDFMLLDKITYEDKIWVITRLFTKQQNLKFAIMCASSVLYIFEKKYPNDKRPRLALEAVEAYLNEPTEENSLKAYAAAAYAAADAAARAADAAARAAYAAARAAARAATRAATAAAYAAYAAARAAARAADAAYAADAAARAAAADDAYAAYAAAEDAADAYAAADDAADAARAAAADDAYAAYAAADDAADAYAAYESQEELNLIFAVGVSYEKK